MEHNLITITSNNQILDDRNYFHISATLGAFMVGDQVTICGTSQGDIIGRVVDTDASGGGYLILEI